MDEKATAIKDTPTHNHETRMNNYCNCPNCQTVNCPNGMKDTLMTQPLPDNLHPSQCYRLLDPERDTLQARDQVLFRLGHNGWEWQEIDMCRYGESPHKNHVYRRPFTPPAPVQVQEFWRLLEVGEYMMEGDEFFNTIGEWKDLHVIHRGNKFTQDCRPVRRRVTVPVAGPAPVADAPKAESIAKSGPFLVSVDGHEAPTMEHATIEDARIEAERLARQEHPEQVRLLRQVAVAKAEVTVKWEKQ